MNCPQIRKLVSAQHDQELDAANTLLVDEHVADCPACFAELRRLGTLRSSLQQEGLRFTAPAELRESVRAAVRQQAAANRPHPASERPWYRQMGWAAAAIALVAAFFTQQASNTSRHDRLIAELTSSHVRSLLASHLMDVESTDQHTVKPWFDGKVDFAPPVRDLREAGFPLLGGRLEVVDGHAAAALVYGRRKHMLNLFIWPAAEHTAARGVKLDERNGYRVLRWSNGPMEFSLVSDVNEADLRAFAAEWMRLEAVR